MSLTTGLISAYTFENAGSMGADSSGNGNTLALTGSVPQAAGNATPGTNAASWSDGGGFSPQGILSASGINGIPPGSDFTMSLWVYVLTGKWNVQPYDMFVAGNFNSGADQYALFLNQSTKEFYFELSGGGAGGPLVADGGGAITLGTWNFVLCQWNHLTQKIGISRNNGALVEAAGPVTPFAAPTVWSIGSDGHGAGFTMDGRTDAVNLWSRLLSAPEISSLYNLGAGLEAPFPSGRRHTAPAYIL